MSRGIFFAFFVAMGVSIGAYALTGSGVSEPGALETVAPVFSDLSVSPGKASAGQAVTIAFMASEPLLDDPVVLINGHEASPVVGKAEGYLFEYTVAETDALGAATVLVSAMDLVGNPGSLSSGAALEIVEEAPGLPVYAWPVLLALLLAGLAVCAHKKRGWTQAKRSGDVSVPAFGPVLLVAAALLASSAVFAEPPTVEHVTFTQRPTATGTQVEITYDLTAAPNGPCDITVSLSKDGGADGYIHPVTSVTGDLTDIDTGTGYTIVWDIAADYPAADIPNARIRLVADDGIVQHTLTYTAGANGSITGASPQTVNHGGNGTEVTAVPNTGYHFVQWSDGILTAARTDTNMVADISVTASFAINTYTCTYTAGAHGSITGPSPQTVNHGGNGTEVTAVPNTGYHFVQWSDGILTAARTETIVTGNITVTAEFAPNANLVFCWANPSGAGSVTGPATILTGGTAALTVSTNPGYTYQSISAIIGDVTGSYPNFTLSNVTADVTVTADFTLNQYTLTYTAGANGSITGTSPQTVNYGGSGTEVTAVPNGSYYFSQWSDGVLTAVRTDTNVTADLTVTATFSTCNVTSVAINSGAATTTNPVVTLNNTCVGSPTQYMASESPTFAGASWAAYGTGPSFALSAGTGGTKRVYFKVRNASGESAPVSDTINLTERTILLPGSVPLVLVWVPSGSYQMGRYASELDSYSSEAPQHPVTLAYGFWMGKYEITQQQWIAVRSTWPGTAPSASNGLGNTCPAYYISWDDTKSFITTLNDYIILSGQGPLTVRLPSEAEWEYACRAGTQTRFYWGDDIGYTQIGTYAWYNGNTSPNGSKPVGGKTPNAFGLYDMSGNVYEWCEDDYHGSYTGAPADGSAWINSPRAPNRVLRGGCWNNFAYCGRSAFRYNFGPNYRRYDFGFRLAAVQ